MKSVVLCADDFGLSPEVSHGILVLLEQKRLSAVSCMTCLPDWHQQASSLKPFQNQAAIGLHFNLTESNQAQPLSRLMLQSLTGRLDLQWVNEEFNTQLDDFEATFDAVPDFIDGHQHVQVFPGIRQVLMNTLISRYAPRVPWVRRVHPGFLGHDAHIKALALRLMSIGFATQMTRKKLPITQAFAGLYSLRAVADFPTLLHGWIDQLPEGGLIMCHPGTTGQKSTGLALTRQREFDYLASNIFLDRLNQQAVQLSCVPSLY